MDMDMEKVICRNGGVVSWERVLGSLVEAVVAEALLDAAGKSVVWLLLAVGSLSNGMTALSQGAVKNSWDAIALLRRTASDVAPENKDDGESDEDEDDDGEDEDVDEDIDGDDDDLSGEEGSDDEDPDDPEANGEGGSDDDDDDEDEEDDEDAEDEEEDEEEDEDDDEETPQPPSKKRK